MHISFADLCEMDADSALQDKWIEQYRARWAGHRAAASVATGDGGAWLDGDAAREVVCEAMTVPVVIAGIDPGAVEDLIAACVQYDRIRAHAHGHADDGAGALAGPGGGTAPDAEQAAAGERVAEVLAMLEHQILATVIAVVSGPGGVASFLRRNLLGQGLNGPSLPLDVGADRPDPGAPAAAGRAAGPGLPVPRRLRPARLRLRTAPRGPPGRRRPDQPDQPQGLLLVAPPRHAAPARLGPDRAPRRHQLRAQPGREDHPQPQPAPRPR